MDNSKPKELKGSTSISIKGTAGAVAKVDISLDGRKPRLKIKLKGKLICVVDLDDVISESLENNALNKKFLKMWKNKFKESSDMLNDFLAHMDEDMRIDED